MWHVPAYVLECAPPVIDLRDTRFHGETSSLDCQITAIIVGAQAAERELTSVKRSEKTVSIASVAETKC